MFIVGGGILTHAITPLHDWIHHLAESAHTVPVVGWIVSPLVSMGLDALGGVLAGGLVLLVVLAIKKMGLRK